MMYESRYILYVFKGKYRRGTVYAVRPCYLNQFCADKLCDDYKISVHGYRRVEIPDFEFTKNWNILGNVYYDENEDYITDFDLPF